MCNLGIIVNFNLLVKSVWPAPLSVDHENLGAYCGTPPHTTIYVHHRCV